MTTVNDVPGQKLVSKLAQALKSEKALQPPKWAPFAKTAAHREKAPEQPDWWYRRAASVLRKLYLRGPLGTERLARLYSGPVDRGSKPNRSHPGSRKILRLMMQQLETAELVERSSKGRRVAPRGQSLLDNTAHALRPEINAAYERLERY
ncbi:MAG: 30S ribosomal protein S19e [Candidatus Poseidoniia archaeon]|jgi:small subunit ribosomal protein S19e|nr:30S ribosomal protein S19e [Candidatus Poseidoniia archaeon]MDP7136242.1 30S ribosomal protein S19e [Candidatus Poseidoniia archaeon]MDP7243084.1 30S ribosomal protein S19e [Candidatus Poseidoniia archaeon]MDP7535584.1 30S ribosomal protein S19e [Candidatus Poseidoniia archaeon]MDP7607169.1 30S ribosomal protein S19e [Candidatus Poseidoniia archaeon]|tara:strand:+ start:570 stop:1019 length:450 start_codon:yes stop_codon:yes gene_type:complete